ncbi:MAG: signal peptidase II [Bacteroidota bacterium]
MKKWPIILTLFVIITVVDQGTKYLAKEHLLGEGRISMANDMFRLQYSENRGAFLSMGANLPEPLRKGLFTGLVAVILVVFLIYLLRNNGFNRAAIIAGALMLSGGVGNLIDRVFNDGAVVDFLNVGFGSVRTGIFNVADMAIMAGLFLFIFVGKEVLPEEAVAPEGSKPTTEEGSAA